MGFVRVSGYGQDDIDNAAANERTRLLNKAHHTYVYPSGDTGQGVRSLLDASGEPIYDAVDASNVTVPTEDRTFTNNGTYYPSSGKHINKVVVNVNNTTEERSITANGTYTPSSGKIGFSKVTVNVNNMSAFSAPAVEGNMGKNSNNNSYRNLAIGPNASAYSSGSSGDERTQMVTNYTLVNGSTYLFINSGAGWLKHPDTPVASILNAGGTVLYSHYYSNNNMSSVDRSLYIVFRATANTVYFKSGFSGSGTDSYNKGNFWLFKLS